MPDNPFANSQNVTNLMHIRSAEAKRTIYTFHADVIHAECIVEKVKKNKYFNKNFTMMSMTHLTPNYWQKQGVNV